MTGFQRFDILQPNTIVNNLLSKDWCLLLDRIGESVMSHLLIHTCMFQALENNCLLQISGKSNTGISVYRFNG